MLDLKDTSESGGHSWNTYDSVFKVLIDVLKPNTILDIGAGSGKYAKLTRPTQPEVDMTAIEIDKEGVERNQLHSIYNEVATIPTIDYLMQNPNKNFDLVVIGDCIEHMRKSEGIDLLNYLNYRAAYIFIITPDGMVMNEDPYYLGHISNWTERDFMWHDNFSFDRVGVMQLFLMRGLLRPELPTMGQIVQHMNSLKLDMNEQDGRFYKHLELNHVNQMKTWQTGPNTLWAYRAF